MNTPFFKCNGSANVTAHCTLLQQLSQDLLDHTPAQLNTGCDSSDCLICQGQRQFCNQAITDSVCTWLGRRRQSSSDHVLTSQSSAAVLSCAVVQQDQHTQQQQDQQQQDQQQQQATPDCEEEASQRPKRLRLSPDTTPSCSSGDASAAQSAHASGAVTYGPSTLQEQQQEQLEEAMCAGMHLQQQVQDSTAHVLQSSKDTWQWQPQFAALDGPAPAKLAEVARLQSAADASAGHCAGRCDRICGLEFSPDGQLLAAAGVSKQIGLYPLSSLAELQDAPAQAAEPAHGCVSSSTSSQRQQRAAQQGAQQQQPVPLLPPVATVRLPGKVSSIAFSPDMHGVISIGDYDGTLTQVHVASGHYLNEVDAHAGRRIWSVCHSKLRHHLAVTASDDCTSRLWSGSGLNTHVATITAPGKPAICCADFSSSNEYLLVLAAADAKVYVYDLRQLQQPLATLHGHSRPVSYAKFFGSQQLVSASIDGTLAVWDMRQVLGTGQASDLGSSATAAGAGAATSSFGSSVLAPSPATSTCCSSDGTASTQAQQQQQGGSTGEGRGSSAGGPPAAAAAVHSQPLHPQQQPWKVLRGHKNEKNFVGLSVDPCSGLMAVGSETSEVFSYHTSWDRPLATYDMASPLQAQAAQQQVQPVSAVAEQMSQPAAAAWAPPAPQQQQSVSAVAWQPSCGAAARRGMGGMYGPSSMLAAATSTGVCRLLSLLHP